VDAAAAALVAAIRAGGGPRLLHARTYRLTGHTSTDSAAWRDADEVAAARANDPITRLEARLLGEGVSQSALDALREAALRDMAAARAAALAAPWPDPASAFADVIGENA